jgi:hypothetical protein
MYKDAIRDLLEDKAIVQGMVGKGNYYRLSAAEAGAL